MVEFIADIAEIIVGAFILIRFVLKYILDFLIYYFGRSIGKYKTIGMKPIERGDGGTWHFVIQRKKFLGIIFGWRFVRTIVPLVQIKTDDPIEVAEFTNPLHRSFSYSYALKHLNSFLISYLQIDKKNINVQEVTMYFENNKIAYTYRHRHNARTTKL